jgi:integrase
MRTQIGLVSVTLKYCYSRSGTLYFQRPIPKDLQAHYGRKLFKKNLRTADVLIAARLIAVRNQALEQEWAGIRSGSSLAASSSAQPVARTEDQQTSQSAQQAAFEPPCDLAPLLSTAAPLPPLETLSCALDIYLEVHPKRHQAEFVAYVRRSFGGLIQAVGDVPVMALNRDDVRTYIHMRTQQGNKTATIRRNMNCMAAVMRSFLQERELTRSNPFEGHKLVSEGRDAKRRLPFSHSELVNLARLCRNKNDPARWLLSILADTGARLAEITGLLLKDIDVSGSNPHVVIKAHPWRSLKNEASARAVPLVGEALWAAQQIVQSATTHQRFAFPQYTTTAACNADSASATLNKWLRKQGLEHTVHELRHTMADRLREVQCPDEVRHAIGGWTTRGEAAKYGKGYTMRVMQHWLMQVATSENRDREAQGD